MPLKETARTLAREIERTYLKVYNKNNKVRLMIENAAPDLLPRELDPDVPDNQILSVALKYKNWEVFIISDDGVFRLVEDGSQELAIDDLPIRELKKYIPDFNEPVFSYLQSNQVKTVGAFRHLTESKVRNMPAKGKQMVYKNTVMRAVKQLDSIIAKIKLK